MAKKKKSSMNGIGSFEINNLNKKIEKLNTRKKFVTDARNHVKRKSLELTKIEKKIQKSKISTSERKTLNKKKDLLIRKVNSIMKRVNSRAFKI
jgi:hypothetical protein